LSIILFQFRALPYLLYVAIHRFNLMVNIINEIGFEGIEAAVGFTSLFLQGGVDPKQQDGK
jgi:hypothetical protein